MAGIQDGEVAGIQEGVVAGTQEDTMRLIKEWHNGTEWCDCFIAPEDTNHFLLKCSKYAMPRINLHTWNVSLDKVALSCLEKLVLKINVFSNKCIERYICMNHVYWMTTVWICIVTAP